MQEQNYKQFMNTHECEEYYLKHLKCLSIAYKRKKEN
jgi:hypothetical protein